jgi:hypothetical protein
MTQKPCYSVFYLSHLTDVKLASGWKNGFDHARQEQTLEAVRYTPCEARLASEAWRLHLLPNMPLPGRKRYGLCSALASRKSVTAL